MPPRADTPPSREERSGRNASSFFRLLFCDDCVGFKPPTADTPPERSDFSGLNTQGTLNIDKYLNVQRRANTRLTAISVKIESISKTSSIRLISLDDFVGARRRDVLAAFILQRLPRCPMNRFVQQYGAQGLSFQLSAGRISGVEYLPTPITSLRRNVCFSYSCI